MREAEKVLRENLPLQQQLVEDFPHRVDYLEEVAVKRPLRMHLERLKALGVRGKLGYVAVRATRRLWRSVVALYRQGRLKLDELISGRYPLEQINEAVASAGRGEALRHVIVFG